MGALKERRPCAQKLCFPIRSLRVTVMGASGLGSSTDLLGSPDPYVQVSVDGRPQAGTLRTSVASGSQPKWNQTFEDKLEFQNEDHVNFVVYDSDPDFGMFGRLADDEIGKAFLPLEVLLRGGGGYNGPLVLQGSKKNATLWVAVEVNDTSPAN